MKGRSVARFAVLVAASLAACLVSLGCSPSRPAEIPKSGADVSAAPSASDSPSAGSSRSRTCRIVVLGDSNSATYFAGLGQGPPWPELMASELETRFPDVRVQLVNTATFGRTSADVLETLEQDCLTRAPDIVLLMIGTNDPGNGIALKETTRNVRTIVKRAKKVRSVGGAPAKVILVQPPVAQSKTVAETAGVFPLWCPYDESEDRNNSLKPMKEEYRRLADSLDVVLVASWDRFADLGYDGSQPVRSEFLFDGLHLSAEGQRRVAAWVGDAVVQVW
jgi:lysophospholipase L1-like esterase